MLRKEFGRARGVLTCYFPSFFPSFLHLLWVTPAFTSLRRSFFYWLLCIHRIACVLFFSFFSTHFLFWFALLSLPFASNICISFAILQLRQISLYSSNTAATPQYGTTFVPCLYYVIELYCSTVSRSWSILSAVVSHTMCNAFVLFLYSSLLSCFLLVLNWLHKQRN